MTQLTRAQTHAALIAGGWATAQLDVMTAVCAAESTLRVEVVGGPNTDGTFDYGLCQINSVHCTSGPKWSKDRLLSDPAYNAECAHALYVGAGGYTPWAAFTSGRYKKYLPPSLGGPVLSSGGGAWFLIHDLQMALNKALGLTGTDALTGTGTWGAKTEMLWQRYQAAHPIEKDVCGPIYWKLLGA